MKHAEAVPPPERFSFITHLDTRHLRWARVFASLIALLKERNELLPSDLFAGNYVANMERISTFWPRTDLLEDFVAEYCDWSEPRWLTFQRWNDEINTAARRFRIPFFPSLQFRRKNRRLFGAEFKQSSDLKRLFDTGERLTPYKATFQNRILPLLTPEVMLLAFVRTEDIPFGESLRESGILLDRLEEAAYRQIDRPEKLRF